METREKKIIRLLHLLNMFDSKKAVRLIDLAKKYSVSKRTVERDIQELRSAGFSIDYDEERGGYVFPQAFSLSAFKLEKEQLESLLIAGDLMKSFGIPFYSEFQSAFKTLSSVKGMTNGLINIFFVKQNAIEFTELAETLKVIKEVLAFPRKLSFYYGDDEYKRTVEPYKVVTHQNCFYLLAKDIKDSKFKTFSIFEIYECEKSLSFMPDKDFNTETFLKNSFGIWSGEKTYKVKIKVIGDAAYYFERQKWAESQEITKRYKNGDIEVSFTVIGLFEITNFLKGWIPNIQVIKPLALREQLKNDLETGIKMLT
ncbi:MAG: WYL domain-containing protein [Nitrospinae bacterium]|nr:WYL domain-containing protein [Nitrospinota bacterium]